MHIAISRREKAKPKAEKRYVGEGKKLLHYPEGTSANTRRGARRQRRGGPERYAERERCQGKLKMAGGQKGSWLRQQSANWFYSQRCDMPHRIPQTCLTPRHRNTGERDREKTAAIHTHKYTCFVVFVHKDSSLLSLAHCICHKYTHLSGMRTWPITLNMLHRASE